MTGHEKQNMADLFVDAGFVSLNKHGEQLCGDHVEITTGEGAGTVIVLADGLGSGVKANILSTLTSKIISTMMANNLPISECVSTIAATLPVCEYRRIAYSTFTILRIADDRRAEIIQYDNPKVVMLRDGQIVEYECRESLVDGKRILYSELEVRERDTFLLISDGVTHAGVGGLLDFGWQREGLLAFLEEHYEPELTSKVLCRMVTDECNRYYEDRPGDDTTVCAVRLRARRYINLMMGPPSDSARETEMLSTFFSMRGKHVVCGGTTASLIARYLGREVDTSHSFYIDPDIPPIAEIEGVDLVTEGAITMNRVLEHARNYLEQNDRYWEWTGRQDGAALVARMLFEEATDIVFFIGRAVNPAHQDETFAIKFNFKMRIVKDLSRCLQAMGKNITVKYY